MSNEAQGNRGKFSPAGLSRRDGERFAVRTMALEATWLVDWQMRRGHGRLLDLSAGGFAARMSDPPPNGRLLHARLALEPPSGRRPAALDAEVRVCARQRLAIDPRLAPLWQVHFAFESLHPVARRQVEQVLGRLAGPA